MAQARADSVVIIADFAISAEPHNLKVAGSNPAPATKQINDLAEKSLRPYSCMEARRKQASGKNERR
jgi:hypothetical protein